MICRYFSLFLIMRAFFLVSVVTLSTGKTLLIVNGYTFKKGVNFTGGSRWWCNEPGQRKCDVFVHVNDKFELILPVKKHNHDPILCRVFQERIM